jgi:hypothetical protein
MGKTKFAFKEKMKSKYSFFFSLEAYFIYIYKGMYIHFKASKHPANPQFTRLARILENGLLFVKGVHFCT